MCALLSPDTHNRHARILNVTCTPQESRPHNTTVHPESHSTQTQTGTRDQEMPAVPLWVSDDTYYNGWWNASAIFRSCVETVSVGVSSTAPTGGAVIAAHTTNTPSLQLQRCVFTLGAMCESGYQNDSNTLPPRLRLATSWYKLAAAWGDSKVGSECMRHVP